VLVFVSMRHENLSLLRYFRFSWKGILIPWSSGCGPSVCLTTMKKRGSEWLSRCSDYCYWRNDQEVFGQFLAVVTDISLPQVVHSAAGSHLASCSVGTGGYMQLGTQLRLVPRLKMRGFYFHCFHIPSCHA
jgi:hypothetical protein